MKQKHEVRYDKLGINTSPAILRQRLQHARQRERTTTPTLEMRLHTLQRTLPADLVAKHLGPAGMVSRIVQIVETALKRVLKKRMQVAWSKWLSRHQILQAAYRNKCATILQKYVRGTLE